MARYIDADALKTDILKKYKQNWEVPCSYEDRIIQRVVTDLRVLIEQNTPADVVPKSEVEELEKEVERLTGILNSYALQYGTVVDKEVFLKKARAEDAKEFADSIKTYYAHIDKTVGALINYTIDKKLEEFLEEG